MKTGKVYLVGAGPGDPELITVKGLKLIKRADVIIYDFLIDKKLLTFAKNGAELICAGKSSLYHSMEQGQINDLLVEKAKEIKIVVRLKNGDPFVFGRGAEEADYLAKHNISYEVISGVSSAIAVPASCGVPLTHRDYASSVAIITGHRKNNKEQRAKSKEQRNVDADTLVFLMAVTNLGSITKKLIKEGRPPDTPCILIEKGTSNNQKAIQGNLGNILKESKRVKVKPPAVFVVGDVVELAKSIEHRAKSKEQWKSGSKPRILFTGTDPRRFRHLGEILHQPLIKIVPLEDYGEVEREIKRIDKYHWVIFTSRYGVEYFFDTLAKSKGQRTKASKFLALSSMQKICVIGKATANKLKEYGIRANCVSKDESSRGIVEEFKKINGSTSLTINPERSRRVGLKGKNILIPCSNLSGSYLSRSLRKMGARVKALPVYKNIKPAKFKKVDINKINELIFTSPSTIKNFIEKYKNIPKGIKIRCVGDVTRAELKKYGFGGEVTVG